MSTRAVEVKDEQLSPLVRLVTSDVVSEASNKIVGFQYDVCVGSGRDVVFLVDITGSENLRLHDGSGLMRKTSVAADTDRALVGRVSVVDKLKPWSLQCRYTWTEKETTAKEVASGIVLETTDMWTKGRSMTAIEYTLRSAVRKRVVFTMDFTGSENLDLATGGLKLRTVVEPESTAQVGYLQVINPMLQWKLKCKFQWSEEMADRPVLGKPERRELSPGIVLITTRTDAGGADAFRYQLACSKNSVIDFRLDCSFSTNMSLRDGETSVRTVVQPWDRVDVGTVLVTQPGKPWSLKCKFSWTERSPKPPTFSSSPGSGATEDASSSANAAVDAITEQVSSLDIAEEDNNAKINVVHVERNSQGILDEDEAPRAPGSVTMDPRVSSSVMPPSREAPSLTATSSPRSFSVASSSRETHATSSSSSNAARSGAASGAPAAHIPNRHAPTLPEHVSSPATSPSPAPEPSAPKTPAPAAPSAPQALPPAPPISSPPTTTSGHRKSNAESLAGRRPNLAPLSLGEESAKADPVGISSMPPPGKSKPRHNSTSSGIGPDGEDIIRPPIHVKLPTAPPAPVNDYPAEFDKDESSADCKEIASNVFLTTLRIPGEPMRIRYKLEVRKPTQVTFCSDFSGSSNLALKDHTPGAPLKREVLVEPYKATTVAELSLIDWSPNTPWSLRCNYTFEEQDVMMSGLSRAASVSSSATGGSSGARSREQPDALAQLLEELHLSEYLPAFRAEQVDLDLLEEMSEDEPSLRDTLRELGIAKLGPREKIVTAMRKRRFPAPR